MKYTHSDSKYDYFVSEFQGNELRISKGKLTGKIFINSEDAARCLGFDGLQEMLDHHPDLMNMYLDGINNGMVKKEE